MDLSNFLVMRHELGLVAVLLLLLIYDIFGSQSSKRWYQLTGCVLFAVYTLFGFLPVPITEAFGGMYVSSETTALMKNILNIATLIVLLQSSGWLRSEGTIHKRGEFFTIILSTLLGMYLMISSGNFMMLYIGIELASLPMACLVAFNKYKEKSAEAGAKYILLSAFSAGIMLFGISLLYGATGTLYFSDMGVHITNNALIIMGFVFFIAGMGFKISIVPFHLWAADVYEGAPTSVTAYLSVASKGAAVFALMFALYSVFGGIVDIWDTVFWWLAVLSITIGNLFAIRQRDIKRFFAFSSISQAGYILLGLMGGSAEGMTAIMFYILVYVFSNLAIFGVISAVENQTGKTSIASYNGLFKANPKLAFVMMLAVFSLGGIPPLAGFFSKFFIFAAAANQGEYLLVFIAILNTVISLYYYLLIVKAMFIKEVDDHSVGAITTDGYAKLGLVICTVGVLALGFVSAIFSYMGNISFGI